jgi:transposase
MPTGTPSPARYQLVVGVDIAAQTVTTVWMTPDASPGRPVTRDQTSQGVAALQARLLTVGSAAADILVVLVVREATGSSGVSLATTRAHAGVAVAVISPDQAHTCATAVLPGKDRRA